MGEATKQVGVKEWAHGLAGLSDFTPQAVYDYIKTNGVEPDSLKPYTFFSKASYTRNLIFKNEVFELIAICWEVGQVSRIHNHRDQQCWMAVPVGKLKNQNYRVLDRDPVKKTCRLQPSASFLIAPGQPAEVDQDEPVHQVLNLAEFGQRAISLHVYSRPFDTCEIYLPEKGTYQDVSLHYTSEYGRLCPGEAAGITNSD